MTGKARMIVLICVATLGIAAAVWSVAEVQRTAAERAFAEAAAAEAMLVSMLDQETGLRGFLQTGDARFLEPYETGAREFELALARSQRSISEDDAAERRAVTAQETIARHWQASAERAIAERRDGRAGSVLRRDSVDRKRLMDRFRVANLAVKATLAEERAERQLFAELAAVAIAVALSAVFCGLGYASVVRPWRMVAERDRRQRRFAEQIQLTMTEQEAYGMLRRQLEEAIPGSRVAVLNRNNSGDRLVTEAVTEGFDISGGLDHAPRACLAIRGGKPYASDGRTSAALECQICGGRPEATTCVPSLVGGEVIGAVLAARPRALRASEVDELVNTVSQAAPNVANLRNLELAERRAMTDSLTGLPNARAVQDAIGRMAAHAGRTTEPLVAVMLDLDHFKAINDSFGHQQGDQVLSAVGDLLAGEVRASDFVGRYGGEEFLVLLPHTNRDSGVAVAEKLREQIESLRIRGLGRRLSASFGVAAVPDDAGDWSDLIRCADRALYAAKAAGRNRVVAFARAAATATVGADSASAAAVEPDDRAR